MPDLDIDAQVIIVILFRRDVRSGLGAHLYLHSGLAVNAIRGGYKSTAPFCM